MNLIDRFTRADYADMADFAANCHIHVPENFNFGYDVVDEYARLCPQKRALVWLNDKGDEKILDFGDIKRLSDQTANMLVSLGVRKGTKIMLILMQRYEYWYISIALHKIGAVLIPATYQLAAKDIAYRIDAAHVDMVISVGDAHVVQEINLSTEKTSRPFQRICLGDATPEGWLNFHALADQAPTQWTRPTGAEATHNDDMMLMYFTSGTSGYPKMAVHDFTYPLGHIVTAAFWQNVQDDGLHLTVADTGWAKSSWGKIYGQWIAGTALFVYDYERFHAQDLAEKITTWGVTTFCAPATVYRFMIKEDLSAYDFSKLRYAVVAGEPLNPEVQAQFTAVAGGIRLMEGYGQTESTIIAGTFRWMQPKPGSMGRPNPNYTIALLDEDGQPVPYGEEGELCIDTRHGKPVGLFTGYYESPEKTQELWHDGYYHTGDVVWRDEDGFLWFVGRADDVIKSSGYRIGPFEVENVLMEHPAVLECAVTGVPDPIRGQAVKGTIVLAPGYSPSEALAKELQVYVKGNTAPYKYPRVIEFVEQLPKTTSGKIRRKDIVKADREKYAQQNKG